MDGWLVRGRYLLLLDGVLRIKPTDSRHSKAKAKERAGKNLKQGSKSKSHSLRWSRQLLSPRREKPYKFGAKLRMAPDEILARAGNENLRSSVSRDVLIRVVLGCLDTSWRRRASCTRNSCACTRPPAHAEYSTHITLSEAVLFERFPRLPTSLGMHTHRHRHRHTHTHTHTHV